MKKQVFTFCFLIVGGLSWFFLEDIFPSPQDKVRQRIEEVLSYGNIGDKLTPIQIASRTQKILLTLSPDVLVKVTYDDKTYEKKGREALKNYILSGLSRLRDFEFKIMRDDIHVQGTKARASVEIRARGEIQNYMEFFSEIHEFVFRLNFKDSKKWQIESIEHYPREKF